MASVAFEPIEAFALSSDTIAQPFVGAFCVLVSNVRTRGDVCPGRGVSTSAGAARGVQSSVVTFVALAAFLAIVACTVIAAIVGSDTPIADLHKVIDPLGVVMNLSEGGIGLDGDVFIPSCKTTVYFDVVVPVDVDSVHFQGLSRAHMYVCSPKPNAPETTQSGKSLRQQWH